MAVAHKVLIAPTLAAWREAARPLVERDVRPETVDFDDQETPSAGSLFSGELPTSDEVARRPHVPAEFLRRAEVVACSRESGRWNLLYRLLWRLQRERDLLRVEVDDDVAEFRRLEQRVQRDLHKMHAFVRFRKVDGPEGETYVAWYEPDNFILRLAAPFFCERFAVMRWSILTPEGSMHWDPEAKTLEYGPGVTRAQAPAPDELEDLWRTYYGSIFNPARTNLTAMRSEMPQRYWKNLPELQSLPGLLAGAESRVAEMTKRQAGLNAAPFVPAEHLLPVLQEAIPRCQGCELYACATQAVFGVGQVTARLMLVGEQPGDEEDRSGKPFVGPAGRLLDELLAEAMIDRSMAYVTNAVKHFKFTVRGKRRLHENPRLSEINACRPWLLAEIDAVQPELIVCLGASAAKSLLGAKFGLMKERGKVMESPWAPRVLATLHPSAILRATDPQRAQEMRAMLVEDLRRAKSLIGAGTPFGAIA